MNQTYFNIVYILPATYSIDRYFHHISKF